MTTTIIATDNFVIVNGVGHQVDCSSLTGIHAVQWNGTVGTVEYENNSKPAAAITDISPYQSIIDAWTTINNTPPQTPPVNLVNYVKGAQAKLLAAGITVNVATSGPAINILCDGTSATRADLAMLALNGQVNPTSTKTWLDNNGISTVLTGTQFVTLATAVGTWIDNSYAEAGVLLTGITANPPTITTTAQIDEVFAAITS